MNLSDTKAQLLQSVDPEKTIAARVQASLILAGGAESRADPLEPILDAPDFPQPMYEALRDLSQDFLFPGLEHVPPNTITLLETNTKFVESFLVGLNAEMSRELLWRNYPTDQRGTYLPPVLGYVSRQRATDIDMINTMERPQARRQRGRGRRVWCCSFAASCCAGTRTRSSTPWRRCKRADQLDLSTDPADESHPLFRGTLKPDVTFLGFALTAKKPSPTPAGSLSSSSSRPSPASGWMLRTSAKPLPASNDMERSELAASRRYRRGIKGAFARFDPEGDAGNC